MSPLPSAVPGLLSDPGYPRLKDYVIRSTGLAYYADKDTELASRIGQRLAQLGSHGCASYLALLEAAHEGEVELDKLIEALTIGETFFFRHQEMFDALRTTVLPQLLEKNWQSRQLRIWSAGCSTGAEAYSLAILLRGELAQQTAGWDITIVGTDINREFLARAHEARFEDWALRGTTEAVKRSYFSPSGKFWCLGPQYRQGVYFQYHNLVAHPFPSLLNNLFAFDLILCRNVTIYFNPEIVRRIVERFYHCLVPNGWFLVGHAEPNMEFFRAFRTVNAPGAVLYQKAQEQAEQPAWTPPRLPDLEAPAPLVGGTAGLAPSRPLGKPRIGPQRPVHPSPPTRPRGRPPVAAPAAQPGLPELETIRALADRGELEEAARCCREVLAKDKLNPAVYFYEALVLEQLGQHAASEHALRRAIYLDRSFVLAHYYLGLLLQKDGQPQQAARQFRNVLDLLARVDAGQVFTDGDGITAGELAKLTEIHLEVLTRT